MKKIYLFLGIILLLGVILRFLQLGSVPVGFHRDEAFLGYNAYSILKTGKDMSGNFLPFHLASFLYSPAGYSYFSIPFIKLFGLSAFSVRFVSALFGSLSIILTFLMVKEIFFSYKYKNYLGIISAFLISISPWHINLSRTATENVLAVFFILLGALLFFLWMRKQSLYFLIGAFFSFGLTLFMYQAPRAFLPIFIPLLIFYFKQNFTKKQVILPIALLLTVIIVPLLIILSSQQLSLRIKTVSIFDTQQVKLFVDEESRQDGVSNAPWIITRVFHNKPLGYISQTIQNYFKHFSYDFLFTDQGFPDRYRIPHAGLLYLFELPVFLFGLWSILKEAPKKGLFLIGWILIAPIGSALTFDDLPNLQRTLLFFPAISIIAAFGTLHMFLAIQKRKLLSSIFLLSLVILITYGIFFYLHQYYVHGPFYRPWYRHDGYKNLVSKTNQLLPNYRKAVITNRESAPTIFFLFYSQYDPSTFQNETKNTTMGDFDRIGFGKYDFSQEECPLKVIENGDKTLLIGEKGILYVDSGLCKVPLAAKEIAAIKREDGSLVFRVLTVD